MKIRLEILFFIIIFIAAFFLSCGGGPAGGFQITANVNDSLAQFSEARIYYDKINLFVREDGTVGYEILSPSTQEYSHLLFSLMGGQKGSDPVFNVNWIAQAKTPEEISGRNFAIYSMKVFPDIVGYNRIAKTSDYIATYNDETCYVMLTVTKIDREAKWMNGIMNGVYIEQVSGRWKRMEIREGRFGANYEIASALGS